jgi:hypothetical protein
MKATTSASVPNRQDAVRLTGLVALTMVALFSTVFSACGGTTTTVETTMPKRTTNISTAPAPPQKSGSTIAPSANGEASEEPRTVPNETGVRLGVAAKDLESKRVSFKVVGDRVSGVAAKSSWTVCETNPSPRSHLESGTTVDLTVAPSCR